jgi:hypothetical protein
MGASISRLESMELQALRRPSNSPSTISHESHGDFSDSNYATEDACGMVSGAPLFGPVGVEHRPSTGVLDKYRAKTDGASGLRRPTSSCSSTLNHEPDKEIVENNQRAIERFPDLFSTTLAVDTTKDMNVHGVSVKDLVRATGETDKDRELRTTFVLQVTT